MRTSDLIRLVMSLTALAWLPSALASQSVNGRTLKGDWVRVVSNNHPNDQMRIHVDGDATLTIVPGSASRNWQVGQVLWRSIQASGSASVRGSDGNYYPATIAFQGADTLLVHVQHRGAGYDQTWTRAGPTVVGEWVRIAPPGDPEDGLRVNATGTEASVRYLPPAAPRVLRVGSRVWQGIGARGALEVLGTDGRYHASTLTLIGNDSLRIDSPSPVVSSGAIWVRPTIVAAARTGLQAPPPGPGTPGTGLQPPSGLPGVATPPTTPGTLPSTGVCLDTSLPLDATGLDWGARFDLSSRNDSLAETLGISDFTLATVPTRATVPVDIERLRLPGFPDGFVQLWERHSRRIVAREFRDLTASEFDQRSTTERANGFRARDVEAYDTPAGVRYAGIWETNLQGVDWRVDIDLTSQEFGRLIQGSVGTTHRLVDLEVRSTPNGLRHAAIWYRSCAPATWAEVRGMDAQALASQMRSRASQGFQVIDVETYTTAGGQRFAAVWEPVDPARGWEVSVDLTLNEFLNDHRTFTDQGLRLIDFESDSTPAGLRYAGVWVENDRRYDMPFRLTLADTVNAFLARYQVPGASVVVMRDDEVLFQGGFGWADQAARKRAYSGTIYQTASIAKVVGATLAARLEGRGLIDLTRQTSDYVSVPNATHTHTLEQLLSKTGCMWHYPEGPEPPEQYYRWRTDALANFTAADSILHDTIPTSLCTPGRHYRYSTHGFTFVGAALEQASGKDIVQLIRDEISTPFGLWTLDRSDTIGPVYGVQWYDQAQGYTFDTLTVNGTPLGLRTIRMPDNSWKILGGGLQTDALDLARFGWLVQSGQLADTTRLFTSLTDSTRSWSRPRRRVTPVGLGWVLQTRSGRAVAEHGGDGVGARPWLGIYRGATAGNRLVVAVMTNQAVDPATGGATPISGLGAAIARIVFRSPPPP